MADTSALHGPGAHAAPTAKTEGDGISYLGLAWFLVVLAVTVIGCQLLMVGFFKYLEHDVAKADVGRAPLAEPAGTATIDHGVVIAGEPAPGPALLTSDPENLEQFRAKEDQALTTYGTIDRNAGTYRIPIDRAKDLLLERGLPVRGEASANAAAPSATAKGKTGKGGTQER